MLKDILKYIHALPNTHTERDRDRQTDKDREIGHRFAAFSASEVPLLQLHSREFSLGQQVSEPRDSSVQKHMESLWVPSRLLGRGQMRSSITLQR